MRLEREAERVSKVRSSEDAGDTYLVGMDFENCVANFGMLDEFTGTERVTDEATKNQVDKLIKEKEDEIKHKHFCIEEIETLKAQLVEMADRSKLQRNVSQLKLMVAQGSPVMTEGLVAGSSPGGKRAAVRGRALGGEYEPCQPCQVGLRVPRR